MLIKPRPLSLRIARFPFGVPIAADDVKEIPWPANSMPQGAF